MTRKRRGGVTSPALTLLFVVAWLYPAFLWLLPRGLTLALFAFFVVVVAIMAIVARGIQINPGPEMLFAVLGVLAVVGAILNDSLSPDFAFFLGMIVVGLLLPFTVSWHGAVVASFLTVLLCHAVATIVFYFEPAWHDAFVAATPMKHFVTAIDFRSGITAHYSWNGMYNALGLVITVPLLRFVNGRRNRVVLYGLSLLFAVALLLTTKRGPLLFAVIALVMVIAADRMVGRRLETDRRRRTVVFGAVATLGGAILFAVNNPAALGAIDRLLNGGQSFDQISSGRDQLWARAIEQWTSSPLIGVGWGGYSLTWSDGGTIVTSVAAHNVLLNLLAETGVVGTCIFVCAYLMVLHRSCQSLRQFRRKSFGLDEDLTPYILVALSIQLFFGLYGLVGNPLYDPPTVMAYFVSVAIATSCANRRLNSTDSTTVARQSMLRSPR